MRGDETARDRFAEGGEIEQVYRGAADRFAEGDEIARGRFAEGDETEHVRQKP